MGFKKWVVKDINRDLSKQLANECDIEPILALIATARGYCDPAELEQFLSDEPCFSDIYSFIAFRKHRKVCKDNTLDIFLAVIVVAEFAEDFLQFSQRLGQL